MRTGRDLISQVRGKGAHLDLNSGSMASLSNKKTLSSVFLLLVPIISVYFVTLRKIAFIVYSIRLMRFCSCVSYPDDSRNVQYMTKRDEYGRDRIMCTI